MSTTGKTPISLLSETLIRRGIHPEYRLRQSAMGVNGGSFVYEVIAGHLVAATGSGRSKKEARQDAAKRALAILKSGNDVILTPEVNHLFEEIEVPAIDVISPYEAELKVNQVGKLIEICAQHNLPQPEYEQVREDGPPHAKHFEFLCRVATMVCSAVGRTKQQAKQQAAHNMLLKMELHAPVIGEEIADSGAGANRSEKPCAEVTIGQFKEAKSDKYPLGMRIGQGFVKDWTDEKIAFIQPDDELINGLEMLETICQELQLAVNIFEVPSDVATVELLLLVVSTTPETSFLGYGPSVKEAKRGEHEVARQAKHEVACQAIEYLQVMTR